MTEISDTANAFVDVFTLEGEAGGPLAGSSFAAKDIYDVAGHLTACGNPDWARTHPPAEHHAAAVDALINAGATLRGKTHTDELAYSLMGMNAHTGTPRNSADPRRVPGGSSSGSVAAVAAGLVDIGLGSDTGGSVRLPAAFCGVYGLRTTHGRLSLGGAMALAPSFDTVGWFTRDLGTMAAVAGACGLGEGPGIERLLLPVDLWANATAATVDAMGPALQRITAIAGEARPIVLADDGLDTWFDVFRTCQAAEVWQTHGPWIESVPPSFGPGIADRFALAASIDAARHAEAQAARDDIARRLGARLGAATALVIPTGPGPAPFVASAEADLDAFRQRALRMLCPAGLGGLPQLSVPAGSVDGGPVGLSLVGPAGSDAALVALAARAQLG